MATTDSTPPPSADYDARLARIERRFDSLVGFPPDAISGRSGSGLVQAVLDIRQDFKKLGDGLAALTSVFEADIAARKADAIARERAEAERRAPWSKAAWMVAGSAIGVVTSSGVGWLLFRLVSQH